MKNDSFIVGNDLFIAIRIHMKNLSLPLLVRIVAASLLLVYLVATSIMPTASAQSASTIVGTLTLVPTFQSVGVYANFSNDGNANNFATLEYRQAGGTWKTGMALVVDRWQTVKDKNGTYNNPFKNQWRVSIIELTPNTTYEVRVTFSDPDGVTGTNPTTGSVTTRNETIALGSGNVRYVSKTGSNSNGGTNPTTDSWLTVAYGLAHVGAGGTLYVRTGTYTERDLDITSGTSWNNLTSIMNYGSEVVVIDGNDGGTNNFTLSNKQYFRIKGLTLIDTPNANVDAQGCSHFVLENLKAGDSRGRYTGAINCLGDYDVVIRYITLTSSFAQDVEHAGIRCDESVGLVIIHDVTLSATDNVLNGHYDDFIGAHQGDIWTGGLHCDSDVYNCSLGVGTTDDITYGDGVELEGAAVNVRCWNNNFKSQAKSAISFQSCYLGPVYAWHNVCWKPSPEGAGVGVAVKCGGQTEEDYGVSQGYAFCYNNTFFRQGYGYASWSGGLVFLNHHFRNNIFITQNHATFFYEYYIQGAYYPTALSDFNYDAFDEGNLAISWADCGGNDDCDTTSYSSLASWTLASGHEPNGIQGDLKMIDPENGNFHLQSTSPCINAGVVIPGFNGMGDTYEYKGSAPDIGAFEYDSGAPTPTPTPTQTPTPSPTSTPTPTPTPSCTGTFGDTNVHASSSANSGAIDAYQATLSQASNVISMSIYIPSHSGSNTVRMAIYSDTSGSPGTLLAQTSSVTATTGWNVLSIGPVSLNAGTYWLALQMSGSDTFAYDTGSTGVNVWRAYTYGAFPSSFGSSESGSWYGSVYASYTCTPGSPTPTPTSTSTPTPTPAYIAGDANGDGIVNSLDITKAKRIIMELDSSTPGADANSDGAVNAIDITRIEQIILGQ